MNGALPTWIWWLGTGALVLGCGPAPQAPVTPAPPAPAEPAPHSAESGAGAEIPAPPQWREQPCAYPESWEGPQPGLVALYIAATSAEIRAANVEYRPPGEAQASRPVSAEASDASFVAGVTLAKLSVEGIEGAEVAYLLGAEDAERRGAVAVVLEGPEDSRIWRVAPRVVEQLAAISDPREFGDRWAATLTEAHKDPPQLTDAQKKLALRIAQQLGGDERRTVENFDDDYVGHQYEPALWQ